ncbi:MAG: hypothetical protein AAB393_18420 [Bacteroidota bacterium]
MEKAKTRTLVILVLITAVILLWANSTRSVQNILRPVDINASEFHLRSTHDELGTRQVLLVVDLKDSNVYARYVAEILMAEGIFCFETLDLSSLSLDSTLLTSHSLVITATSSTGLASCKPDLEAYVRSGGRLLMIAPPSGFEALLGVQELKRTITDGYVLFDSSSSVAAGLSHVPLQFFGPARLYDVAGATVVASLSQTKAMAPSYVAAGTASYKNGKTGFIVYDLGQSIVFTRQGRPPADTTSFSVDKDGDGVFKTADLFYDSFDYINRAVPQADEQQNLLVNMILGLLKEKTVLPRVWYFPDESPAIALLTGDHHGWTSQQPMRWIAPWLDSLGGRFSFFVYPDQIDTGLIRGITAQGHTVAPHLYYPAHANRLMRSRLFIANWFSPTAFFRPHLSDLELEIHRGEAEFQKLRLGRGLANRFHYLIWWGWAETPQLLSQNGFQIDFSISGVDPHSAERPNIINRWNSPFGYGYVNGSGQPMKVMNREGKLIDLYCQLTIFEDDVVARECVPSPPNDSITTARLIDLSKQFIDKSIADYHTVLVWNFHPEHTIQRWPEDAPTTGTWLRATAHYLKERNVPMLSVHEWLTFLRARRTLEIEVVNYDPSTRRGSFFLASPLDVRGVTLMIPVPDGSATTPHVSIVFKGPKQHVIRPSASVKSINGVAYAVFQTDLRANRPASISYSF